MKRPPWLTLTALVAGVFALGFGAGAPLRGQQPAPPPPPTSPKPEGFCVAIDIGHTPRAPGARGARGQYEYAFNLRLCKQLLPALVAAGYRRSFLINPDGQEITLLDRARIANERQADLFLAIHHDSVQDSYLKPWTYEDRREFYCDLFHGYGIFHSARNRFPEESLRFADLLGRELLGAGFRPSLHHAEKIAGESKTLLDREKGIYEYTNLVVLKWAAMPAALLECGVLVNREEETQLQSPAYQRRIINALVRAVDAFAQHRPAPAGISTAAGPTPLPSAQPKTRSNATPAPARTVPAGPPAPDAAPVDLPRSVVPTETIPLPSR